jgi:hypothetical protein
MRKFAIAMCALLALLAGGVGAKAQVIYDEYNAADLAAGITAYSGPVNGTVDVERFLARHVGLAGFNFQVLEGVQAGQPIWCSTKMRLSDMVREKFSSTMAQYQFLCRTSFMGAARYFRLALGPPEQAVMSFTEPFLGAADASIPAMHWYYTMYGAGWFPAKTTTVLTNKARLPRSLGCGSLMMPQPAPHVRVVEWSFCKHVLTGEQYSIVVGIVLPNIPGRILYITSAGIGMFRVVPLETLVIELVKVLRDVRYVEPGS